MKRTTIIVCAASFMMGCSAEFTDLRPDSGTVQSAPDSGMANANATSPNAQSPDSGAATNDAETSDAADAATADETLIATGDFVNVDYQTSGSAQFWRLADGSYEVRLTSDFSTQGVPGPALALSPRNPLGGSIDADELDIGGLDSNSGMQSYSLPGPPTDYAYTWIWCEPFGLDVAYAAMEFQ